MDKGEGGKEGERREGGKGRNTGMDRTKFGRESTPLIRYRPFPIGGPWNRASMMSSRF